MKITVVNSPHLSSDRVRKVILDHGSTVTYPLLKTLDDEGLLKGKTEDSFALGAVFAKFAKVLTENHDKYALLMLLERLTDADYTPFVEKDNPDKVIPPDVTLSKMNIISGSGATETSDQD